LIQSNEALSQSYQALWTAVSQMGVAIRTGQRNIGTLRRGSSYVPTPHNVAPLPEVIGRGFRVQQGEVNRYGRFFRAHAQHFNSDCDVVWNRRRFYVNYRGIEIFSCSASAKDVKNAYGLLRILDSNLTRFDNYLKDNGGEVPDVFDSATSPCHSDVDVEEEPVN